MKSGLRDEQTLLSGRNIVADFTTSETDSNQVRRLLNGCLVPRPIAFVSTSSPSGQFNLAPFSFFGACGYSPPTLAFSVELRDGAVKDTAFNIINHPEFVVHIVSESLAEKMNLASAAFAPEIDEFEAVGLTPTPSAVVGVPRVKEALIAMECRLSQTIMIGKAPSLTYHFLGEIVHWHIDDGIVADKNRFSLKYDQLAAIGRMGGTQYVRASNLFDMNGPYVGQSRKEYASSEQTLSP
jgi:flavin reductase (DIM6/NTAB) family NADH-FMN oxidoreductase RutF